MVGITLLPKNNQSAAAWTKAAPWCIALDLGIAQAVNDASLLQVVGTHLHLDRIAGGDLDKMLAQFTGNMGQNLMSIGQFNPEHGTRQDGNNLAFYFYVFFAFRFRHKN